MGRTKTYSKARVAELMAAHYPVYSATLYSGGYCKCGSAESNYEAHIKQVLRRNPGDV